VGLRDLFLVRQNLGQSTGMSWSSGDMTGDGRVDRADLALLAANFGHRAEPSPAGAVVVGVAATDRRLTATAVDRALTADAPATANVRLSAGRARHATVLAGDSTASATTSSALSTAVPRRGKSRLKERDENR
jgi:hypothetical protein